MHGDTPPAIVAIDGALVRQPGLGARLKRFVQERPAWFVADDDHAVVAVLRREGIDVRVEAPDSDVDTPSRPVAVVHGGLKEAIATAAHRHTSEVRVWLGAKADVEDMAMDVRIAAHDAGIRLRIEAPLEGAS